MQQILFLGILLLANKVLATDVVLKLTVFKNDNGEFDITNIKDPLFIKKKKRFRKIP